MRANLYLIAISLAVAVHGHYVMLNPQPLTGTTFNNNNPPCGTGDVAGSSITQLQPNSWVNISWHIQQSHNRMTTIALSEEDSQAMSCVLLDYIPVAPGGGNQNAIISVWIPDVMCNNCTLQVKNVDWYSCARVRVMGSVPRAGFQCSQPCSWPYYQSTTRVTTADDRWTALANYPGRTTRYLNIYGQANMTTGTPDPNMQCTDTTAVVGAVTTTSDGVLNIPAGASLSTVSQVSLMGTTALWIERGTRSGNTIQLTIAGPPDRWFAVGFHNQMVGADAVIWSSGKTSNNVQDLGVGDYYLTAQTLAGVEYDTIQNWVLISSTVFNNSRFITVQRQVNTMDTAQDVMLNADSTPIIWAMGDASGQYQLAAHGPNARMQGSVLTWTASGGGGGGSSGAMTPSNGFGVYGAPAGSSSAGTSAHGFFMFLSWGLMIPIAVLFNRYRHQFLFLKGKLFGEDRWFQLHRGLNCGAVFFMFIGIVIKWGELGMITNSFHSVIGMMLFFLAAISIAAGFLRPAQESPNREMWLKIHRYAGFSYLFVAFIIQIPIGLSIGGATAGSIVTYVLWLLIVAGVIVWLERRGGSYSPDQVEKTVEMNDGTKVVDMGAGATPVSYPPSTNPGPPPPPVVASTQAVRPPPPAPAAYGQAIVVDQGMSQGGAVPQGQAPPPPPPSAV